MPVTGNAESLLELLYKSVPGVDL